MNYCLFFRIIILLLIPLLSSCASARKKTVPAIPSKISQQLKQNITHTIAPGETLWRLSKMYDVPIGMILKTNNLSERDTLKMGQEITIPNASNPKPVISVYPTNKWKYIIVHHSATEEGNSLMFHKAHLKKGWDKGVGYHFVIDRRGSGQVDGQIEVTPRWLKQQDGAHCKADGMNIRGIGICLVGNFDQDRVSNDQMDSLIGLVQTLMDYYKIPPERVLRHGGVDGAQTHCPGIDFPWEEFKRKLKRKN